MPEPAELIAQARALAEVHGWHRVVDFVAGLPTSGDERLLVLAAEESEPDAFLEWLAKTLPGTALAVESLEARAMSPDEALEADRVLAVFRCGELLTAEGIAAAAPLLERPQGTVLVVLVGAEAIATEGDLDLVERGVWQVLVGESGTRWAGQDLAARGCLLWSAEPGAESVRERMSRDVSLLTDWLRSAPTPEAGEALGRARARQVLWLAEDEAAQRRAGPAAKDTPLAGPDEAAWRRRLTAALADVERLHHRLLDRIDTSSGVTLRQVVASLESHEQDLLREVEGHLEGRGVLGQDELQRDVERFVRQGLRRWQSLAEATILHRARQTAEEFEDLLADVDWASVNEALAPSGRRYPEVIADRFLEVAPGAVVGGDMPVESGAPVPPDGGHGWPSIVRITASGAALAAVTAAVLGPVLVPMMVAGAVGATGAGVAGHLLGNTEAQRRGVQYARTCIRATVSSASRVVQQGVRDGARTVRRGVHRDFTDLEEALRAVLAPVGATPSDGSSGRIAQELAELRALAGRSADPHTRTTRS